VRLRTHHRGASCILAVRPCHHTAEAGKVAPLGQTWSPVHETRPAKETPRLADHTRGSEPQALPVHPWSKRYGHRRCRLDGAQILGGRPANPVCDNRDFGRRSSVRRAIRGEAKSFGRNSMKSKWWSHPDSARVSHRFRHARWRGTGQYDDLPAEAFYFQGDLAEIRANVGLR
jgi:hypothetical protein